MNNNKKTIMAIVITIVLGLSIVLGSFALWTTQFGNNINVAFNTASAGDYVDYTAGKAIFAGNLETTNVYSGGTYTTFSVATKNNPSHSYYASLNIKIKDISEVLTHSRVLKWTITQKETNSNNTEQVIAEADFVGTSNDDTIQLVPNIAVTSTKMDYNVYLWVDSTNANASSVVGEKIDIELWMDIYEYRAPKVLDAYCYNNGTTVMCNILDSERSNVEYGFSDSMLYLPNSYTNEYSTSLNEPSLGFEYWVAKDDNTATNMTSIGVRSQDNREISKRIKGSVDHTIDLPTGLIPISFPRQNGSRIAVADTSSSWYDYDNKKWANAVLVKETATESCDTCHDRSYYIGHPGEIINSSDILAYYVYIPRYSYKVWQYSGLSASGQEREIEIKFVSLSTIETATQNGEWHTHPAFWWDDDSDGVRETGEELKGIWVGKFETSHQTLSIGANNTSGNNLGTCTAASCANYTGIRILPNVRALRYNTVSRFFYASRHMTDGGNPFGLSSTNADSHLTKNSEWGAAAYLAHSKYGINAKIRINNNNAYKTGCGAASDGASAANTCIFSYDGSYVGSSYTQPQSTTGNVTGIYDMSGGSWDIVMGVWNKKVSSSGFSPLPDAKYYDNYPNPPFNGNNTENNGKCTIAYCGGHALNETHLWFGSSNNFVDTSYPWFVRGGVQNGTTTASAMHKGRIVGSSDASYGARYSLIKINVME